MKKFVFLLASILLIGTIQAQTVNLAPLELGKEEDRSTTVSTHIFNLEDSSVDMVIGQIREGQNTDQIAFFNLSFEGAEIILPVVLDKLNGEYFVSISGQLLKGACDKLTKGVYMMDKNKKRTFYFPYNKFGIACPNQYPVNL